MAMWLTSENAAKILLHEWFIYVISYIHFIDIKGTAWGHGQVNGICFHAIFYISYVEREPGITQD